MEMYMTLELDGIKRHIYLHVYFFPGGLFSCGVFVHKAALNVHEHATLTRRFSAFFCQLSTSWRGQHRCSNQALSTLRATLRNDTWYMLS